MGIPSEFSSPQKLAQLSATLPNTYHPQNLCRSLGDWFGVVSHRADSLARQRNYTPNAICMDHGLEFINDSLQTWCMWLRIEIQITALYSPSQNGVAEQMNRTLMELAHTMLMAWELPEFLWEPATLHTAYL